MTATSQPGALDPSRRFGSAPRRRLLRTAPLPLHAAIDRTRWRRTENETIDDPALFLPGRVGASSLGRPWCGLTVWLQRGPIEDLYIPASRRHAILIRVGTPTTLLQQQGGRMDQRVWRPGECVVVPAGRPSFWRSDAERENIHVDLDPIWLARACGDEHRVPALGVSFGKSDPVLSHIGQLLLHSLASNASLRPSFADGLAMAAALHLIEHYAEGGAPRRAEGLTRRQLRIVMDAVEAEIENSWPLEGLAALLGLSASHFARAFKVASGETPHRFLMRMRLERARRLVLTTDRPLLEIALDIGFGSLSHFGQAFRRQWGTSPSLLRRAG